MVLVLLVVGIAILLPILSRSRIPYREPSCQHHLKQMGLVFMMYANESEGEYYPPLMTLSDNKGFAPIPSSHEIIPEYLSSPDIFNCPKNKNAPQLPEWDVLKDQLHDELMWKDFTRSYNYYGWLLDCGAYISDIWRYNNSEKPETPMFTAATAVKKLGLSSLPEDLAGNEEVPAQLVAFYEAINKAQSSTEAKTSSIMKQVLSVENQLGNQLNDKIYRLRFGIEGMYVNPMAHDYTGCLYRTPIMWDTPVFNPEDLPHSPGGLNVLFMDGHAEFIQYPTDRFPVTEGMAVWSRFNEVLLWGE